MPSACYCGKFRSIYHLFAETVAAKSPQNLAASIADPVYEALDSFSFPAHAS